MGQTPWGRQVCLLRSYPLRGCGLRVVRWPYRTIRWMARVWREATDSRRTGSRDNAEAFTEPRGSCADTTAGRGGVSAGEVRGLGLRRWSTGGPRQGKRHGSARLGTGTFASRRLRCYGPAGHFYTIYSVLPDFPIQFPLRLYSHPTRVSLRSLATCVFVSISPAECPTSSHP